jgi:hypothetical protein
MSAQDDTGLTFLPLWPNAASSIAGAIDYISPEDGIFGWVVNTAQPAEALSVLLICGDACIGVAATVRARDDIAAALAIAGTFGFHLPWADVDLGKIALIAAETPDIKIAVFVPAAQGLLLAAPGHASLDGVTAARILPYVSAGRAAVEEARRAEEAARLLEQRRGLIEHYISGGSAAPGVAVCPLQIDAVFASAGGTVFITGWIDDRQNEMTRLDVFADGLRAMQPSAFGRLRRPDVEAALDDDTRMFGFWTVVEVTPPLDAETQWLMRAELADGHSDVAEAAGTVLNESGLRTTILEYLATMEFHGDQAVESYLALQTGIGDAMCALNRRVTAGILANPWVSYHGPRRNFVGSVIVCLAGMPEVLRLQTSLFSAGGGAEGFEFIYVLNSPALAEGLEREARISARIYGVSIVLICLSDNAGAAAANNIGARHARSKRLLFAGPDVFPKGAGWGAVHAGLAERALLFGVEGVRFEVDEGVSVRRDGVVSAPVMRVEQGAGGAFLSVDRGWFEKLGGFNEGFAASGFEDFDFCLRSRAAGQAARVVDFPLLHMEEPVRERLRAEAGGALFNRWLFTRAWAEVVEGEMGGDATRVAFSL